ncbi:hypothetical protein CIK05_09725 [Bdellovibrio sp. qaytius]|nr:hypothetical protein CIK05_09725 [Bdellovibrio sp. qaytius]
MRIRNIDKNISDDLLQVYKVFRAAYAVEAEILDVPPTSFFPLTLTLEDLEKSEDEIFGIEVDGTLAGAIFLEKSNHTITISSLVVDPKYFRKGLGKSLINYVLQKYRTMNFLAGTGSKNIPAIKLYEKFGFQATSEETVEPSIRRVNLKRLARDH